MASDAQASADDVVPASRESLLPLCLPVIREAFESPEDAPFQSDYDYFRFLQAVELLRAMRINVDGIEEAIFDRLSDYFGQPGTPRLVNSLAMRDVTLGMVEALEAKHESRLAAHDAEGAPLKPRMVRLGDKLELTDNERRLFRRGIVSQLMGQMQEVQWNGAFRSLCATSGFKMASELSVNITEVERFFDSGRKHIKESIINAPQHLHQQCWIVSDQILGILYGLEVSASQFMSIESGCLGEVLREEPGFDESKAGKAAQLTERTDDAAAEALASGMSATFQELREAEDEDNIYLVLRRQESEEKMAMERLALAGAGSGSGEGEGKGEEEGVEVPAEGAAVAGDAAASDADAGADAGGDDGADTPDEDNLKPYTSDLQYLQDTFHLTATQIKVARVKRSIAMALDTPDDDDETGRFRPHMGMMMNDEDMYDPMTGRMLPKEQLSHKREANLRKLQNQERVQKAKIDKRLVATLRTSTWRPRLERLSLALALDPIEKAIIITMIGSVIAPQTVNPGMANGNMNHGGNTASVGDLLLCHTSNLEEQIEGRRYFTKSATLVKEGILVVHNVDFAADLGQCNVEIDRRMLDYCLALNTPISENVDGSQLYMPDVNIDDVVLPEDTKQLLMRTVRDFDTFRTVQKRLEVSKTIAYGRGQVLLFYGGSGTGKTMMANALATSLGKKVLLINFPSLGMNNAAQVVRMIFREAKIHSALLFFDECESIFLSRERGSHHVNMLLTELERYDGLTVMATNRPQELDEAMHRRINLAIEFRKPDHILRERIWRKLQPERLRLADDVDIPALSLKFELTGGFIKNVWLSALSIAVSRDGRDPTITMADMTEAAAHQLRGRLSMADFDRRVVPSRGLDDVCVEDSLKESLREIVDYGKAQAILFGQWGFHKQHGNAKGIAALFHGPPGTGKTMAAEAIGYDLGMPLKVVNVASLLSKWVGESQKNIDEIFTSARAVNAVLVFDEAEGLFGSRNDVSANRHDNLNVGVLLHHIETHPGVTVVITNMREAIDTAFFRRFKTVLHFDHPSASLRRRLWRLLLPQEAPTSDDVDLDALANRFELTGGAIKSAVFRAASKAALRTGDDRIIRMQDLTRAADEEVLKTGDAGASSSMYS